MEERRCQWLLAAAAGEGGSESLTDLRRDLGVWFGEATRLLLAEAGIEPSVGSVGDSYDNALAETINGLYKAEVIYKDGPWRGLEQVELATLDWVDWFNNRRLLEPIGNIPPIERESAYYAVEEAPVLVAGLK